MRRSPPLSKHVPYHTKSELTLEREVPDFPTSAAMVSVTLPTQHGFGRGWDAFKTPHRLVSLHSTGPFA